MADKIEDLIAESQQLQKGLLATTAQLDEFIEELSAEIKRLRQVVPDEGVDP